MARACLAALLLLATAAVPGTAGAAFNTCDHVGATVTARLTSSTTGRLSVDGNQIHADGAQCDVATTTNTNEIIVEGDADYEVVTLDLSGGPFAPGFNDEAGTSDEIEFLVQLQQNDEPVFDSTVLAPDLIVNGSSGSDHIVIGHTPGDGQPGMQINLNAAEADGVDADIDFLDAVERDVEIATFGGADIIDPRGGAGTGPAHATDSFLAMFAGSGDDDVFCDNHKNCEGGPGDDDLTMIGPNARVTYTGAGGGVTVDLGLGPLGGMPAGEDGDGGTDTFHGFRPGNVLGSTFGDTLTAADSAAAGLIGLGGGDVITGGPGSDLLNGGDGQDTIRGHGLLDFIFGGQGNDDLDGGGGNDDLYGGPGDDEVHGGDGDDLFGEWEAVSGATGVPTGSDDFHGDAGSDMVAYTDPFFLAAGRAAGVNVDFDGMADDGASAEGDNARPDVEIALGGFGDDTLEGDGDPNALLGLDGADVLRGGGGDDVLYGLANIGLPSVEDEADDLDGGAGADVVRAADGDDQIEARDGFADDIGCGDGTDSGRADAVDTISSDCENIALPVQMPAEPPVTTPPSDPPPPTPPGPPPPPRTRRVRSVSGTRVGLPIDLRGLPKGRVRVRLRVELADGRIATDTRTYRTCATKRRRGRFGRRRG